jgi:transglutaminase-like putative cysteine protease
MTASPRSAEPVSYEALLWICGCLVLALIPHVAASPIWVLIVVGACGAIRLLLAARGRGAPPSSLRLIVAGLAIGLLFLQFRTFNGLAAGRALLCLMAGLKLLETQTRRDVFILALIAYFLSLSALLESESFWLLAYLVGVCWLTTATLLRLSGAAPRADARIRLGYTGRTLAQALPLALMLWLLFPRFAGPLWQMPGDGRGQESGLSDTMSPGDIDDLALSDEIAFRVRFADAAPPPRERYWRGPVLHDFDGHTWRRTDPGPVRAAALVSEGRSYLYTVSLEPNHHNWIFVLDWPAKWNLPGAALTSDYMLVQPNPLSQSIDVTAVSYTRVQAAAPLTPVMRRRDTWLPPGRNPRTLRLSQELRSTHPDDMDYVRAVLQMFAQEQFFYTLTPPKLAQDSVDEFLFDTKRGFCGHYASAFAMLMRAAGIPARVVTGYQGGSFNRFAGYWILRQSDAHAWDEIWIDGRGWLRVDPTAAVAPERIERGSSDVLSADDRLTSRWQLRAPWLADLRLRLDALKQLWHERILKFDEASQIKLLKFLWIPEPDGQKLVMVLAAGMTLALAWLTWQVRRELHPAPKDPLIRAFERLCRKLAAAGLPRRPYEGAEAYAARVAVLRPDLAPTVEALCRSYSALRYGTDPGTAAQFASAVHAFRPRRLRLKPRDSRGS